MFATNCSLKNREWTLSLLAFTAAVSLWIVVSVIADLSGRQDASASDTAQCQNASDVLVALDRSRNGVSLTCNRDILSRGKKL